MATPKKMTVDDMMSMIHSMFPGCTDVSISVLGIPTELYEAIDVEEYSVPSNSGPDRRVKMKYSALGAEYYHEAFQQ